MVISRRSESITKFSELSKRSEYISLIWCLTIVVKRIKVCKKRRDGMLQRDACSLKNNLSWIFIQCPPSVFLCSFM